MKRNPYKAGSLDAALWTATHAADAEAKTGHGGARPGAGRPSAGADKMAPTTIRLTAAQRDKLARLGGADFIRRAIDQAREP